MGVDRGQMNGNKPAGKATDDGPKSVDNRTLPTAKRKPATEAQSRTYVLYGIPKVGKSTWAAGMPEPLFFAFEDGCRHLEVFITPEKVLEYTWSMWLEDLRRVHALVKSGKCPYKTLVIDVAELCFEACRKHCLKKYGAVHESDLDYGKGWSIVEWEFSRVLSSVKNLGLGLVLLTHMDDKEIADFSGKKHTKHTTALPKKAREIVFGMADVILFAQMGIDPISGKWRRELHTKPSQNYEAGGRYLNPEGMPRILPLAWEPFRVAFELGLTEQQLAERFGFYTRKLKDSQDTHIGDEEPADDPIDHTGAPDEPAIDTASEPDPFEETVADQPPADHPAEKVEPFAEKVPHVPPDQRSVKGDGDSSAMALSRTVDTVPNTPAENDPVMDYAREVNGLKGDALTSEWDNVSKRVNFTGQKPRKVGEARSMLIEWFRESMTDPAQAAGEPAVQ